MKIALDAMGGDYAPEAIVKGAALGRKSLPEDAHIVLVGKEDLIKEELNKIGEPLEVYTIVHADEVIEMGEHPTKAISQKKNSSVIVGYHLLKTGQVDVFSSCGNTGAMLVGAMFTIKSIEGVIRPGIAGFIPKLTGKYGILLDVGANADCKPDVLNQFAEMGSIYYEHTFNQKAPRVGLLNLGEEESKGTLLTQAAFQLLKINSKINFIGNIEGRDVFTDKADIIICDGFSGNIVLKLSESMYPILSERGFVDDFVELFNWANVGGSPILGVNGNVIIGHGVSTPEAVNNMLNLCYQTGKSNFSEIIKSLYQ